MKAVEEKGQQLVRVLLLVARELWGEAAHLGLEDGKHMKTMTWGEEQKQKEKRKTIILSLSEIE